jgi:hypothetical protein
MNVAVSRELLHTVGFRLSARALEDGMGFLSVIWSFGVDREIIILIRVWPFKKTQRKCE